jgi:hypothetical protein
MDNTVENTEGIVLDDAVQAPETPEEVDSSTEPQQKEPGWYKARFAHDLEKERKKWEAEQEEKLAPIYEYMMDREANELVSQGEFKSLDRAKEYLRMKKGMPVEQPQENDPMVQARADLLAKQAEKIKANRGLDVMSAFNSDPDVKQRILSGEWDFYDVAETMKKPLAPVRSSNGAGVSNLSIQNMSDEQFQKLQANLAKGGKYDMRK